MIKYSDYIGATSLKQAIEIFEDLGDRSQYLISLFVLSGVYLRQGNFTEAAVLFDKIYAEAHHTEKSLQAAWGLIGGGAEEIFTQL